MTGFLLTCAVVVLFTVGLSLARLLRGSGHVDRMMAGELLGTGGVAALLLFGVATQTAGVIDLALLLALLAAFAAVAYVASAPPASDGAGVSPAIGEPSAASGSVATSGEPRRDPG